MDNIFFNIAKLKSCGKNLIKELTANVCDTLILLESGHGYEIIDNNTQVLEIKNGPYLGAEIDRRRF